MADEYDQPPGLGDARRSRQVERDGGVGFGGYGYAGYGSGIARFGQAANRHNTSVSVGQAGSSLYRAATPPAPTSDRDTLLSLSRSTLWWGELEPWMDEEYVKQVCSLMGWDPATINIPHSAPDHPAAHQPNNPGYCFLTFPSTAHAASVLAQITPANGKPLPMPNSSKPFVMNWASSLPAASPISAAFPAPGPQPAPPPPSAVLQYPKEYSIFVGDLAPETSNSDLVAVFRNPVLGLRNDREPKFIRPFLSCKSAKIMLDPMTGVSRGYGFVRFTDEADQQRALIEMHGLYCLSRPMRISPATAKFKPAASFDMPQVSYTPPATTPGEGPSQPVTLALPLPTSTQTKSVSAPIAAAGSSMSLSSTAVSNSTSGSSIGGSHSSNSLSSAASSTATSTTSDDLLTNIPHSLLLQLAQQYGTNDLPKLDELSRMLAAQTENPNPNAQSRYVVSEESWKHHAQARAILGNIMGPNGEQLTSTDPYNTTVFVGGLSPLISEETLRTFFAPFGDIHYVKVPVGKHCGFVQFVRKADAEKAIEKMQGFPIGGSRIRLSWGRSQYKAAQAAAQAAQNAALQSSYAPPPPASSASGAPGTITQEQAIQLLQKFGLPPSFGAQTSYDSSEVENSLLNNASGYQSQSSASNSGGYQSSNSAATAGGYQTSAIDPKDDIINKIQAFIPRPEMVRSQSSFSPFSPDPNNLYTSSSTASASRGEFGSSGGFGRFDSLPHPSKAYAPGFFPQSQEGKINTSVGGAGGLGGGKVSPTAVRPSSASRYSFTESGDSPIPMTIPMGRGGRTDAISRPASGQLPPQGAINTSMNHNGNNDHEADIQDLNGTLASLDLDRRG